MSIKKRTINATGMSLGRLASEIAQELQGKTDPSYARNSDEGNVVVVTNLKEVKFTGKKLDAKKYYSYSGYPGGLKEKDMADMWKVNPSEVLRRTVWNMLPKNTLREKQIERLIVK